MVGSEPSEELITANISCIHQDGAHPCLCSHDVVNKIQQHIQQSIFEISILIVHLKSLWTTCAFLYDTVYIPFTLLYWMFVFFALLVKTAVLYNALHCLPSPRATVGSRHRYLGWCSGTNLTVVACLVAFLRCKLRTFSKHCNDHDQSAFATSKCWINAEIKCPHFTPMSKLHPFLEQKLKYNH